MEENQKDEEADDKVFEEMIYEPYDTRGEVINMCCSAVKTVEDFDEGIETKENRKRIKDIKRMALRLIHYHLSMLYDETFETE